MWKCWYSLLSSWIVWSQFSSSVCVCLSSPRIRCAIASSAFNMTTCLCSSLFWVWNYSTIYMSIRDFPCCYFNSASIDITLYFRTSFSSWHSDSSIWSVKVFSLRESSSTLRLSTNYLSCLFSLTNMSVSLVSMFLGESCICSVCALASGASE